MRKHISTLSALLISASFGYGSVFADPAPVVSPQPDFTTQSSAGDTTADNASNDFANLSTNQKLAKLQQQLNFQLKQDFPQQIENLQQQIQTLTGELQQQSHEITLLKAQLVKKTDSSKPNMSSMQAPTNKPANKSVNISQTDYQAYENAYTLVSQKKYSDALSAFQTYLKQFPQGRYVSNAHFWAGEIYLIQNSARKAASEFTTVVQNYPSSNKVPDALLKLGFIYADNGQLEKAKSQLERVLQQYPDSSVAQLAQNRLQVISQSIQPKKSINPKISSS